MVLITKSGEEEFEHLLVENIGKWKLFINSLLLKFVAQSFLDICPIIFVHARKGN